MTATMQDVERTHDVDDPDDHIICVGCYPGFQPGVMVIAICGADTPDVPPDENFDPDDVNCTFCVRMHYCPICGDEI